MPFPSFVATLLATLIGVGVAQFLAMWYDRRKKRLQTEEEETAARRRAGRAFGYIASVVATNAKHLLALRDEIQANRSPPSIILDAEGWHVAREALEAGDDQDELHGDIAFYFQGVDALKDLSNKFHDLVIRFNTEPRREVADAILEMMRTEVRNVMRLTKELAELSTSILRRIKETLSFQEFAPQGRRFARDEAGA